MICPVCGTENRESARFCDGCGHPLAVHDASFAAASSGAITQDLPVPTVPVSPDDQDALSQDQTQMIGGDSLYIGMVEPDLADIPDPFAPSAHPIHGPSQTQEMPRVGEGLDAQSKAYIADASKKQKKLKMPGAMSGRRKALIALLIAVIILVLGAGVAFATYSLQFWGGKQVPNVIGMKAEEATARLEAAGFAVTPVLVKSDDVEGIVLKTTPEADARAEAGSEVTIDVSCARTVPDVMGKPQDEALALLESEGFQNVQVTEQKSNEAQGVVIAISPEPGVRSKAQATITLTVAIPFVVPATEGLSVEEAQAALEAEGYVVSTSRVYTEDVPEGTVLGTDPAAGTELPSGSGVTINIAKSRASEVVELARSWFAGASTYTINGMSYELKSVSSLDYQGNDSCSFTVVMQPFETHSWFGSQPETRYGNEQSISGTMTFTAAGELASIDPALKKA